jgi:hypothetical protein
MILLLTRLQIADSPINIPNYILFPYPRQGWDLKTKRVSGGIAIYVKENIQKDVKPLSNYFDNLVWLSIGVELAGTEKPIALATAYFPPEGSTHNCNKEDYFNRLEQDCSRLKGDFHIAVCGDLNARTADLSDIPLDAMGTDGDLENLVNNNGYANCVKEFPEYLSFRRMSQDMKSNEYGKKLLDFCKACSLRILNGRAFQDKGIGMLTRIETTGCSVVDYLLCDAFVAERICDFKVDDKIPESDHCALVFSLKILNKEENMVTSKGVDSHKYKWDRENIAILQGTLLNEESQSNLEEFKASIIDMQNVNIVSECWSSYFIMAVEKSCTKVKCRKMVCNKAPWVDAECMELRQKIKNSKCASSNIELTTQYRNVKQRKKRQYSNVMMQKLSDNCGKNGKLFWKTLDTLPSANKSNREISDPLGVCDKLRELSSMPDISYFDRVYEQKAEEFLNKYDKGELECIIDNTLELQILNNNFSLEEIECATKKLKSGKSPGLDMIPAEFVKYNIDHLKVNLQLLYNYILSKGEYPEKWAEGLRVAIPKDGGDIRPITIEPIFGKILETIIDNRLNFINEAFNKHDKYNGGFLKGSMTQDNMLILLGCIQKQLLLGKPLYIAFVDFKKAFNYINRKLLFYKIIKAGRLGKTINLLRNMFEKIKARVKVNGSFYEWIEDKCGTNQGGPVSPNMFRFMLSDLKNYFMTNHGIVISEYEILTHILWADDLAITADCETGLQEQLDGLFQFCCHNQMIVNEVKTKVVIFGQRTGKESFTFNGKTLDVVDKYKYLGNLFNSVIKPFGNPFREMSTYLADKALRASFATLKRSSSVGFLPPKVSFHLFDSCVLPILEYGSELWGNGKQHDIVERVHLKFLKLSLGVKSSTCTTALYGETGRFPIVLRQKVKLIKYWLRLQALPDTMIVKQVYTMLKNMDSNGYVNWSTNVKEVLSEYGLQDIWYKECIPKCEIQSCISNFKICVYKRFTNNWYNEVQNFTSMRTYIQFKTELCMESYLLNITDYKVRKMLSKFRLSSHNLEIERGRHCKPKILEVNRLCKLCNNGKIENEQHMVTECVFYGDLRKTLFNNLQKHAPDVLQGNIFCNILSCKNARAQFCFGKYLIKGFKKRESALSLTVL